MVKPNEHHFRRHWMTPNVVLPACALTRSSWLARGLSYLPLLVVTSMACTAKRKTTEENPTPHVAASREAQHKRALPAEVEDASPAEPKQRPLVVEQLLERAQRFYDGLNDDGWKRHIVEERLLDFGPPTAVASSGRARYWLSCNAERCTGLYVIAGEPALDDIDAGVINEHKADEDEGYHGYSLILWRSANKQAGPKDQIAPAALLGLGKELQRHLYSEWNSLSPSFEQARLPKPSVSGEGEQELRWFAADDKTCVELHIATSPTSLGYARTESFPAFANPLENELYAKCALAAIQAFASDGVPGNEE